MKTQRRLTRVKVGLVAAATLSLALVAAPTATAQLHRPAPRAVVTPADDLPATATVRVDMSGFEPEEAVFIQQCAELSRNVFGCDYDHTASVNLDEDGAGSVEVTVSRVFEAHDESGELIDEVDCVSVELGCNVSVGNFGGATDAKISFRDGY